MNDLTDIARAAAEEIFGGPSARSFADFPNILRCTAEIIDAAIREAVAPLETEFSDYRAAAETQLRKLVEERRKLVAEAAELRAAIGEHDPALACLMLDSAELTASIGVYLSGRRETIH